MANFVLRTKGRPRSEEGQSVLLTAQVVLFAAAFTPWANNFPAASCAVPGSVVLILIAIMAWFLAGLTALPFWLAATGIIYMCTSQSLVAMTPAHQYWVTLTSQCRSGRHGSRAVD